MFVDASAIIAILARESDASALAGRLDQADKIYISPIVEYEAVLGLARMGNASVAATESLLRQFLDEIRAEIVPISAKLGSAAVAAFDRFGKGRHAAGLNMGDCFAYACAQDLGVPLLFKGNDFPRTDVVAG
jgi:ribonuclease VapC